MQAIGARGRLQAAEDYRQTEGIKGRLHSHGTHAQRYDTHAETDWGRLITIFYIAYSFVHSLPSQTFLSRISSRHVSRSKPNQNSHLQI